MNQKILFAAIIIGIAIITILIFYDYDTPLQEKTQWIENCIETTDQKPSECYEQYPEDNWMMKPVINFTEWFK